MNRSILAAAALALLAAAPAARAEAVSSPLTGSLELRLGNYRPSVDSGPFKDPVTGVVGPGTVWKDHFGTKRPLEFSLHAAKALPWRAGGTLEVGLGAGYFKASGFGRFESGAVSGDKTTFNMIPTELTLTYRLDFLMDRYSIPLLPYARVGLERYNWWITGSGGSSVKSGATNGYAYGGGLALVLDQFDPTLARELDADTGINHTAIVFDVKKTKVDDFGSKKSWDLSDTQLTWSVGLLFVY